MKTWISDVFCLFLPACAGIRYEGMRVYSREIKWDTSGWLWITEFRCILFWQFWAIHRNWSILPHPDVYLIKIWTSVHRDGNRILNPDVSPTETRVIIHRKGPNSGISDVCSKNHIFQIHRDSTKISDSDVSQKRIHRNSTKSCNPDVSYLPNPSKTPQIKYQNNYLDSLK